MVDDRDALAGAVLSTGWELKARRALLRAASRGGYGEAELGESGRLGVL